MQLYRRRPSIFRVTQRAASIQSFTNQGETVSFCVSSVQSIIKHTHTKHAIPPHTSIKIWIFKDTENMKQMTNQSERTCFFVSPTLVPKHKNAQLPSSATTFSSNTAILPQTSRIGPNAAKRNIIVIGVLAAKMQLFKRLAQRALRRFVLEQVTGGIVWGDGG